MKVALVYDRVNKFGGAERLLLDLHEIWPSAPLYTSVHAPRRSPWADGFTVVPSILQQLPLPKAHHELYPYLMPMAFESFRFEGFDVVISVTSAEAKGIVTKPGTMHICYILTPTRYLWNEYFDYQKGDALGKFRSLLLPGVKILQSSLRQWDAIAAHRPDKYIAISQSVARRLKKYYRHTAPVIYPPVDTKFFCPSPNTEHKENYFLIVSRLVPYKRIDIVIDVFNALGWKLKIIGSGLDEMRLRQLAGSHIEFIGGNLTEAEVLRYYQGSKALIVGGEEDFGLVALEALACGRPVIAYHEGGVAEIVSDGVTGLLYDSQTADALYKILLAFKDKQFSIQACRKRALEFDKDCFRSEFQKQVEAWVEEEGH